MRAQPPEDRVAEWLGPNLRDDTMVGLEAVLGRSDLPTPAQVAEGFAEGTVWNYSFPIMAGLLARWRAGRGLASLPPAVLATGLLLCHDIGGGWCQDEDLSAFRDALEALILPTSQDRVNFTRLWIEPSLAAGRSHIPGLYMFAHNEKWLATGGVLAAGWLTAFLNVPENIELELVDCLTHSGQLVALRSVAIGRANTLFRNFDHMLAWLAIDVLVCFDTVVPDVGGIGSRNPEFIWFLRDRFQLERRGRLLGVSPAQAKWIISEFRREWPYAVLEGNGSGDTNPYDATDFLRAMMGRLADDASAEASEAMQALITEPTDSYTDVIRHTAAEQRQKRAEQSFAAISPKGLGGLFAEGPPSTVDDLKSLVVEELGIAQRKLMSNT